MSVKGMMQTVLVTELKQIQPDISNEALQYVVDNFSQVFDVREILAEENQELFQSNKNLNMALQKVSDYNLRLENERDALAAQVTLLREAYKELSGAINDLDDCESDTEEFEQASANVFAVMQCGYNNVLRVTPQQCLAEIKAEAVKDFVMFLPSYAYDINGKLEKEANKFAEKVRQGGER